MLKIEGSKFIEVVSSVTGSAKKAHLGGKNCYLKLEGNEFVLFYASDELQVEKKLNVEGKGDFFTAVAINELAWKVPCLPADEEISVSLEKNGLLCAWGRSSSILIEVLSDIASSIELPTIVNTVTWQAGFIHKVARGFTLFAGRTGNQLAKQFPAVEGVHFSKDPLSDEILVRATDGAKGVSFRNENIAWFDDVALSIPSESLLGLAVLFDAETEVNISINDNNTLVVFQSGSVTAVSRVLSGAFPPLGLKPTTTKDVVGTWTFDRMELINLCKRVGVLGQHKPIVEFRYQESKVIAIQSNVLKQQLGAMVEGVNTSFLANANYLEVASCLFRTEEIQLLMNEKQTRVVVTAEDNTELQVFVGLIKN